MQQKEFKDYSELLRGRRLTRFCFADESIDLLEYSFSSNNNNWVRSLPPPPIFIRSLILYSCVYEQCV